MPIVNSNYEPPFKIFRNGDLSTLYAATLRKAPQINQTKERVELSDGDFLDVEWSFAKTNKSRTCLILLHGLEGHAKRPYILGSAKLFNDNGIDACAVYYRSCSGEANRLFCSYHSGRTNDVQAIVDYILETNNYDHIIIKGFSLGGNLALKYVANHKHEAVKAIIAISSPVDLASSIDVLESPRNFLYAKDFIITLKKKLIAKQKQFPDKLSIEAIRNIKSIKDYDDFYTSRANGFENALDYYTKCSAKPDLYKIDIPTLIINAKNDSFLSEECYPTEIAKNHKNLFLEIPKYGGHVGFVDKDNIYYNEKRAIEFVLEKLSFLSTKKC